LEDHRGGPGSEHPMSVTKRQVQPSPNSFRTGPDERGHFGIYGGRFVAETLMPLILDLEKAYAAAKLDPAFQQEMDGYLRDYVGRPSPLYFAERLTQHCGGAKIFFKREELNHTGAHKVNNVLGQIMVARRMGKKRIIAETGAGMHGVATATLCARFGLDCIVYMGAVDVERQKPNVFRMQMLGAEVRPVVSGSKTLKDAMNEALRDWVTNVQSTFYCIGTVAGPHPYPMMVREFQSVIGRETREQMLRAEGRLPDSLIACIGGGSNAMGLFHPFLDDTQIEIYGVEAAGHGLSSGLHAASIAGGRPGVLHGNRTYLLMDDDGQIKEAHSISAGLDYPGVGPEHAWLNDVGRVTFLSATDDEALAAFQLCSRLEGIIPALEPAHALAKVLELAPKKPKDHLMVVNLSGRGDKDLASVAEHLGRNLGGKIG
jgi:tryptophan synthase beta chain